MPAGRKTKYTKELGERIAALIAEGATQRSASLSQGVAVSTFHEWLHRHGEFAEAVTRAEATMLAECAKTVYYARVDDPRMALEILKRREPDPWADARTLDLTSAGQPLKITLNLGDGAQGAGGEDDEDGGE